ncbi:hypothetical protein F7725_029014 [Dissostichus mawsoni]|uniref:Chemokine interleukin-8-like domain-containing protein n=1 Tax=Dissostichus mawsoni TaxID=36200 RepID=A0A7J5XH91_DISMA|nr:hypothetical protein F7725_029014 [Dissostichus mawsoni]
MKMENCGSMFKGVLVAIALVVMAQYGSAEKLDSCCKTVSKKQISDPIIGYYTQKRNPPCVTAIIFQTEKGYFCSYLRSPWVLLKIRAFNVIYCLPAVHHYIHCSILHSSSFLIPHSSLLILFSLFLVLISRFLILFSLFLTLFSLFLTLFLTLFSLLLLNIGDTCW